MGKYASFRSKLPAFEQPKEWQQKVDDFKQEFIGTHEGEHANAAYLAREYAEHDARKKALEEQIASINIMLEAISQLGCEALEEQGLEKVNLASGGYVRIDDRPYTSIEDRSAIFSWIKKNKLTDLLSVNYQTLNGMNNERLVSGKAVIPGTRVFIKTKLSVRGVNGSNSDE
jgi:hypothetical protein